ncbi:uncharacterized protein LOC121244238 [Juglans microcarpa x Juglans regia]|uniref:uncharacterized protein LOC121244238 n=1 Tax=Juglans microcarpa x Juglans regia TaxID=2249226 RepID=UPI001B7E6B78|nr:uncharacterized protein LOC121244238 [Juglans microcarpa x Juglans regia]
MVQSVTGGRRGRGGRVTAVSSPIGRGLEAVPPRWNLCDEVNTRVDGSTQAAPHVGVEESRVPPTHKRGRGLAKGTKFDRLRRLGKIPLDIKDDHIGPSCENAMIFTGRVSWIIKVQADMTHASWSVVSPKEKDELIDHVKADFVLDWTRLNHRETVMMALADKYNAFHYELHKEYLKYSTHEEALSGGTSLVEKPIWECLCQRWASNTFKDISQRNKCNRQKQRVKHTGGRKSFVRILEEKRETTPNLVAFYKEVYWSRKKGKFINATSKHNYNLMVEKLNEKEPDEDEDDADAAEEVFKKVLGQKSGNAQDISSYVLAPDNLSSMM